MFEPIGQDIAEYDFRDFRNAKIERFRRLGRPFNFTTGDESLLQFDNRHHQRSSSSPPPPRGMGTVNIQTSPTGSTVNLFQAPTADSPFTLDPFSDHSWWTGPPGWEGPLGSSWPLRIPDASSLEMQASAMLSEPLSDDVTRWFHSAT